jgi:ubiquinone/menaquinone biosynthesis C-methylase UbiE
MGIASGTRRYRWFYDHILSRGYDAGVRVWFFPFGGEAAVRRSLVAAIGLSPGGRVLDLCCGTGGTTHVLRDAVGAGSDVYVVDLSLGQLRRAVSRNQRPNVRFLLMDAGSTGFRDGSFGTVVIPHALHEMWRETRLAVLAEARRLLKDGGLVAVLELDRPNSLLWRLFLGLWWYYWLPFNFETPTRRDMIKYGVANELAEAGFTDVTKHSLHHDALQVVTGRKPSRGPGLGIRGSGFGIWRVRVAAPSRARGESAR